MASPDSAPVQHPLVGLIVLSLLALGGCGSAEDAPPLEDAPATAAAGAVDRLTTIEYADTLGIDFAQMQRLPVGLYYRDLVVGAGEEATSGSTVTVHYTLYFPDGTNFESSRSTDPTVAGTPLETAIGVGQVIPGWDHGIPGMRVGGRRTLVIPPELGYGRSGQGSIPPNAVLVFDVELLAVR